MLEDILNKVRINRFSESCIAMGATAFTILYMGLITEGNPYLLGYAISMVTAGLITISPMLEASRQNRRYERLCRLIENEGYDENSLQKHMGSYCGRLLVKNVLNKYNLSKKYNHLLSL